MTSLASAQTLYVSLTGTGTQCSIEVPCNKIQSAIDLAQANDRINIQAGKFIENIKIPADKEGLMIKGAGKAVTMIQSNGGLEGVEAPAGVAADIVIDIFAKKIMIRDLTVVHGRDGGVLKHDIGIFVRPPSEQAILMHLNIKRLRESNAQTPPPPAIGILVMRATRVIIKDNNFIGGYDDNIHIPSSKTLVVHNKIMNAKLHGIIIVQEPPAEDGTLPLAVNNSIIDNLILNSGDAGIEIQGDDTLIMGNKLFNNSGLGIVICGDSSTTCDFPRGVPATATGTSALGNFLSNNKQVGLDQGVNTFIRNNIIQ